MFRVIVPWMMYEAQPLHVCLWLSDNCETITFYLKFPQINLLRNVLNKYNFLLFPIKSLKEERSKEIIPFLDTTVICLRDHGDASK